MWPSRGRSTLGDVARGAAQRQGLLYFRDVAEDVRASLGQLTPDGRRILAVACAERAMAWHLRLPDADRRPFTLEWQPVLAAIRAGLLGDRSAEAAVRAALEAFHASPYDHSEAQDGPDDADEDAAAAASYAAECFLSGMPDPAAWVADRIVEIRLEEASADLGDRPPIPDRLAVENAQPVVQAELQRQLDDLAALARDETSAVLERQND
jgi:hypothetical protein